jgi:hypothetical protein
MNNKMSLNANAKPWVPEMQIIMSMSYEEFRENLLNDTLPYVSSSPTTPVLFRDTNKEFTCYSEWAYENRERLGKIDVNQLFESSPFSFICEENEWVDKQLEELYKEEEEQWIKDHPEIFVEEDIIEWV